MTPADPLARTAARTPDAPAVEGIHRRLTFGEVDAVVDRLAADLSGFLRHGNDPNGPRGRCFRVDRRPGADSRAPVDPADGGEGPDPGAPARPADRLAFLLRSRFDTTLLLHAGSRAGFTVAPLSPDLTSPELRAALTVVDPVVVLADSATVDRARSTAGGRRVVAVDGEGRLEEDGLTEGKGGADEDAVSGTAGRTDSEAGSGTRSKARYLVWTSGSSGRPRGVVLTEASLGAVIEGSAERLGLGPRDRWLTTLSIAHVGGLATVIRATRLGATLVVRDTFDEAELLDLAGEGRVTHASLVPVMLRRILARAEGASCPPALRCFLVGGAHAPPELVREAVELGYPVALTYGMTETSSQSATAAPSTVRRKPDTVGTALPGVRIRIAEDGEIRVRGPNLAAGYLASGNGEGSGLEWDEGGAGSPDAALTPLDLDEEGWLRTGDLGTRDEEGDLRITGRLSTRIVTGGVTVDPREVEIVLRGIPGIEEAVVVGIPDEEWGERVSAALVATGGDRQAHDSGSGANRTLERETVERLRDVVGRECRHHLSGPKRPRLVRFLDALPRTGSGKVDRAAVRAILREGETRRSGKPS